MVEILPGSCSAARVQRQKGKDPDNQRNDPVLCDLYTAPVLPSHLSFLYPRPSSQYALDKAQTHHSGPDSGRSPGEHLGMLSIHF